MGWFGRDTSAGSIQQEPLETAVGPSASVTGHLKSDGGVRIDGAFEGVIEVAGNVVVGEGATVVADITARNITVGGAVKGNIDGAGRLEILSSGEVYGDIMVGSVMIDEGGVFQGTSRMRGMDQRALAAPKEAEDGAAAERSASSRDSNVAVEDITFTDEAVEAVARPAPEPKEEDEAKSDVAVPDLDQEDIEPIIPDIEGEEGKAAESRAKPRKKKSRRK